MKRTTTTTASKAQSKATTKATAKKATGAKLKGVHGEPVTWKQAIKNCITAYDENAKLREKVQRQYKGVCVDTERDGITDPADKIHPPESVLKQIQAAIDEQKKQAVIASDKYKADLQKARIEDSFIEQREAEAKVKYGSVDLEEAGIILNDILFDAGALALSLRAPCFLFADTSRLSRSNKPERYLFSEVRRFSNLYPPQARRDAHLAKTKEERNKILLAAQIAERNAMQEQQLVEETKRKGQQVKAQDIRNAQRYTISAWARSQGIIEYVHGDHITFRGEKVETWKLTTPKQWDVARLAICDCDDEGHFTVANKNTVEHAIGGNWKYNQESAQYKLERRIYYIKGTEGLVYQFMYEAKTDKK